MTSTHLFDHVPKQEADYKKGAEGTYSYMCYVCVKHLCVKCPCGLLVLERQTCITVAIHVPFNRVEFKLPYDHIILLFV